MKTADKTKKTDNKKILFISYHFPPSSAVGGMRIANFVKYLPLYGWNPYVLTIKDASIKEADTSGLNGMKAERIFRTGTIPRVFSNAYMKLKEAYGSRSKEKAPASQQKVDSDYQINDTVSYSETLSHKLKRWMVSFLTLPDGERNWIFPAVFRAVREIKRNNISCILTSGPPHSAHIIGLLTKTVTGVKWVADYRDPWIIIGSKRCFSTSTLSVSIERWLERQVINKADLILSTTEKLCGAFREIFKKTQRSDKFLYISNGFDKELFQQIGHFRKYERFTITYAGTLYYIRTPEPVFEALRKLIAEAKISPQSICVKLLGHCEYINGYPTADMIQSYNLDSVVEVLEPVSYYKALEVIKQSHLALLLAPAQPFQIPAKVYDYLGMGTRILALTENGATWDLITSTGSGTAFYPTDIDGIKEFIYRSMCNADDTESANVSEIQNRFDRKLITRDLANHLDRIV
jgi:hypothetical protein